MIQRIKHTLTANNLLVVSLVLLIGLGPILTYATKFLSISPVIVYSPYSTGFKTEIFNHCKSIFLLTMTTILLFIFFYKLLILKQSIKKTPLNVLITLFFSAIWISTALSPYKHIALFGNSDRFEGAIAWSCYILIFFIIVQSDFSLKQRNILLGATIPFLILNTTLGLLHFFDMNILQWGWVKVLIGFKADAVFNSGSSLWTTLYNPNFISGVGAMFFIGCMAFTLSEQKIRYFILAILSFILVLTSLSSSGFLTIVVLFPVVAIIMSTVINKKTVMQWTVTLFIGCSICILAFSTLNNQVWDETIGLFQREMNTTQPKEEVKKDTLLPTPPEPGITFGTGRVYIWKETLQVIKEKPLFGYGFDTFPYILNNNKLEKIAHLGTGNVIIDKPHNWFLTVAYGSGIFGLIGLCSILLWGFIQTWKKWMIKTVSPLTIPLFLTIIAYCIQGLFNDSFIGSSILFWGLLGCCYKEFIHE